MLKKAAALLLVCASMAICFGCSTGSNRYLYAAIPGQGGGEIVAYREDPNSGALTQLAGSPITAGPSVESIVIHPSKKYLYAANSGESDVSLFTISTAGGLQEVTPRTAAGTAPTLMVMDSAGSFLYVANSGSFNVSVFSIDSSSGVLTTVGTYRCRPEPARTCNCRLPARFSLHHGRRHARNGPGLHGNAGRFGASEPDFDFPHRKQSLWAWPFLLTVLTSSPPTKPTTASRSSPSTRMARSRSFPILRSAKAIRGPCLC